MVFKQRTFSLINDHDDVDSSVDHHRVNQPHVIGSKQGLPKKFSVQELMVATSNFSCGRIVGRGGFGVVYRGVLADGSVVAVKRLGQELEEGETGLDQRTFSLSNDHNDVESMAQKLFNQQEDTLEMQFRREIEIGMMAQHPNLLRLLGFCFTNKEKCLVYPFVRRGSADSHLQTLDWPSRKKIALGVSRALSHLHDHCNQTIIHLDVKPANILLTDNFEPLLTDFGFAELVVKKTPEVQGVQVSSPRPTPQEIANASRRMVAPKKQRQMWGVSCSNWNITEVDDTSIGSWHAKGVSCWYWSRINTNEISSSSTDVVATTTMITDLSLYLRKSGLFKWKKTNGEETNKSERRVDFRGTYLYAAPEFLTEGSCSEKADVFGYGVTVCELITGKSVHDLAFEAFNKNLRSVDWVKKKLLNSLADLNPDDEEEVVQLNLTKVALLCMNMSPGLRPKMAEVVMMLQMDADCLAEKWDNYYKWQRWS